MKVEQKPQNNQKLWVWQYKNKDTGFNTGTIFNVCKIKRVISKQNGLANKKILGESSVMKVNREKRGTELVTDMKAIKIHTIK